MKKCNLCGKHRIRVRTGMVWNERTKKHEMAEICGECYVRMGESGSPGCRKHKGDRSVWCFGIKNKVFA